MRPELLNTSQGKDRDSEGPAVEIKRLRAQIDSTRDELGTYISELDRRRHEALDVKLQIRKHSGVVIGVGVAIVVALAGSVAIVVRSRRRETTGRKMQRAILRLVATPSPAPREPGRMLSLLLRAALPFGVAVARGFLGTRSRRSRFA
jgi:hypothetical protein